jgi:hypothetical protein
MTITDIVVALSIVSMNGSVWLFFFSIWNRKFILSIYFIFLIIFIFIYHSFDNQLLKLLYVECVEFSIGLPVLPFFSIWMIRYFERIAQEHGKMSEAALVIKIYYFTLKYVIFILITLHQLLLLTGY